MDDVDGLLATIDGALGDYTVSADAARWSPPPPQPPPGRRPAVPALLAGLDLSRTGSAVLLTVRGPDGQVTLVSPEALIRLGAAMTQAAEVFGERVRAVLAATRRFHAALVEAGPCDEQPPTSPRARALWLRQHRPTGPAIPARPAARVDPTRARR